MEINKEFAWEFNVKDKFKSCTVSEIKETLKATNSGFSVMMTQLKGDFNFSSVVRSANGFNAKEVFYFGKKKWDRRGSLGTHHYTDVKYISSMEELILLKENYCFVALENTGQTSMLHDFDWKKCSGKNPLIILGEEACGLPDEILKICDYVVEIPMMGSVRSFNAAVAASIVMYDFIAKKDLIK